MRLEIIIQNLSVPMKEQVSRQIAEGSFISFVGSDQKKKDRQGSGDDPVVRSAKKALLLELLRDPAWQGAGLCEELRREDEMSAWIWLPPGMDASVLLKASLLKGAAFEPDLHNSMKIRIDYKSLDERSIREGMRRIGEALSEFTARYEG